MLEAPQQSDDFLMNCLCVCQLLAVPVETKVHLYERGSWEHVSTLSDDVLTQVREQVTRVGRCLFDCLGKLDMF